MKKISSVLLVVLFASCLQKEKKESTQLDIEVQEIQRLAFWQRAYYFESLRWKDVNTDSMVLYKNKMDSVTALYRDQMIRYDTILKLYKQQK